MDDVNPINKTPQSSQKLFFPFTFLCPSTKDRLLFVLCKFDVPTTFAGSLSCETRRSLPLSQWINRHKTQLQFNSMSSTNDNEQGHLICSNSCKSTNLFIITVSGVARDCEVLQQVNAVVLVIATQASPQESFSVIVVPERREEDRASSESRRAAPWAYKQEEG